MAEEMVTVYKVYFPHPDYAWIVSENIYGLMATMEEQIENIDCFENETIDFKVVRTQMPRQELDAINENSY